MDAQGATRTGDDEQAAIAPVRPGLSMEYRLPQLFTPAEPTRTLPEPDLAMIGRILARGWRVMTGALLLSLALAALYAYGLAPSRFSATTVLAIEARSARVVDLQSVVSGVATDDASINTELEVIRSRGVLEKLVQQMGLMADLEFNPTLSQGLWDRLAGHEMTPAPQDAQLLATTRRLRAAIAVHAPRNTFLIEISARAADPAKAAAVADALAALYIAEQIAVKFDATEDAVLWMSERVATLEAEIAAKEAAIEDLRARAGLLDAADLDARGAQLREVRLNLAEARATRTRLDGAIATADAALRDRDFARVAEALAEPSLHLLLPRIAEGAASPAQFAAQADQVLNRRRAEAIRAGAEASVLAGTEAGMLDEIGAQAADLSALQQLQRERDATRVLNETFLARLKEVSVQRGLNQADARILSAAAPGSRVAPRRGLILVLAAIGGAVAGAAILLARHFLYSGYRTFDELERDTGLRVLGQIPQLPVISPDALVPYLRGHPGAAALEAVRDLRSAVLPGDGGPMPGVVMITSSLPAEGKTTLAIALAQSVAGLGRRVLLIEGDIRRRTLPRYLGQTAEGGLLSVLRGGRTLAEVAVPVPALGFDLLLGEDRPGLNATDIFAAERFAALVAEARESYDLVVIDTPPAGIVADARVIARVADAVLHVVAWNRTPRARVAEALRPFAGLRGGVVGLVLTQVDPQRLHRYGYEAGCGDYGAGAGYYSG